MIEKEIWKTLIYRGMPIQRLEIYCVENNMIYESITEAARTCQIFSVSIESARKNISRALRQNQKAYGKTWKYLEDKVDARE